MDDEKGSTSYRQDDRKRETPLHDYVGGVISNPEPRKKTDRKEESDTPSKAGDR